MSQSSEDFLKLFDTTKEIRRYGEQDTDRKEYWNVYDKGLENVGRSFVGLWRRHESKPQSFKDYLELILRDKKGQVVLCELGGPGNNLVSDFSPGFIAKSVGFTIEKPQKKIIKKGLPNHQNITADIFSRQFIAKMKEWLGEDKVDILIERMFGPNEYLPFDVNFFYLFLKRIYPFLNNGSICFFELPLQSEDTTEQIDQSYFMVEFANRMREYDIEVSLDIKETNVRAIKIYKGQEAPEELPDISFNQS